MTTIAFDGRTLASDRRVTGGGLNNVQKVVRLKDGALLAGAGILDHLVEVSSWLNAGGGERNKPDMSRLEGCCSDFIYVTPTGVPCWLTWPWLRPVKIEQPFIAMGSGGEYAMGAMAHGASARRAVAIACQFDPYSGEGIDAFRVRVKP